MIIISFTACCIVKQLNGHRNEEKNLKKSIETTKASHHKPLDVVRDSKLSRPAKHKANHSKPSNHPTNQTTEIAIVVNMWIIYYGFTVLLWIKNDGKHLLFVLFMNRAFDLMSSIYLITWIYFALCLDLVFFSFSSFTEIVGHPFSFHLLVFSSNASQLNGFFSRSYRWLFSGISAPKLSAFEFCL